MVNESREPRPEYVYRAEAARHDAEALKFAAEAREISAAADKAVLEALEAEEAYTEKHAANKYHHVYRLMTEVNSASVKACVEQLDVWSRTDPACTVRVIFNSPGGSLVDGMALWDYFQSLRAKGHRLETHTEGMAASMTGILLQAGDVRSMGRESYLLIHEVQAGMMGSFGELSDRMEWLKIVQGRILDIFAYRSHLTKAQIKTRWTRTDWWIDSEEALKLGLVDHVE